MTPRSPQQRLEDILAAIRAIRAHEATAVGHGLGRGEPLLLDAVVRQLAVIGEAVSALPDEVVGRRPDIPWDDIAGMRLLLDHRYHRVDAAIVWNTVDGDLAPLEEAVTALMKR